MKYELKVTDKVIQDITNEANEQIANKMSTWLANKSQSPEQFYIQLSDTIESIEGKGIVGSGLTEYIMSKRGLVSEFIDTIS